jgi:hypothetical protein
MLFEIIDDSEDRGSWETLDQLSAPGRSTKGEGRPWADDLLNAFTRLTALPQPIT